MIKMAFLTENDRKALRIGTDFGTAVGSVAACAALIVALAIDAPLDDLRLLVASAVGVLALAPPYFALLGFLSRRLFGLDPATLWVSGSSPVNPWFSNLREPTNYTASKYDRPQPPVVDDRYFNKDA